MATQRHSLTNLDRDSKTADCVLCGHVRVYRNSVARDVWSCSIATLDRIGKPRRTLHKLSALDTDTREAICSLCGPVAVCKAGFRKDGTQVWRCFAAYSVSHVGGHGLTMVSARQQVCEVGHCQNPGCGEPVQPGRGKGGGVIDHDHFTGEVRGVLCSGCNVALGYLRDDRKRILGLVDYLDGVRG